MPQRDITHIEQKPTGRQTNWFLQSNMKDQADQTTRKRKENIFSTLSIAPSKPFSTPFAKSGTQLSPHLPLKMSIQLCGLSGKLKSENTLACSFLPTCAIAVYVFAFYSLAIIILLSIS